MLFRGPLLWVGIVVLSFHAVCAKRGKTSQLKDPRSILRGEDSETAASEAAVYDLLHESDAKGVSRVDDDTWRWKTASQPVAVEDSVRTRILLGGDSLSLSLNVRASAKRISTIFHAFENIAGHGSKTWIEILINTANDTLVVRHRTMDDAASLVSSSFELPSPTRRNWVNIHLSFGNQITAGRGRITLWVNCAEVQSRDIAVGANLHLPWELLMEIGGNSANPETSFTGQIRQAQVHVPATPKNPSECDISSQSRNKRKKNGKRGASSRRSASPKRRKTASKRETAANATLDEENSLEAIIAELRSEIKSCRDESTQMNNMMQMMKQQQASLEDRVALLETCECIPMCIAGDGVKRRQGEIWEVDECKTCKCSGGRTTCQTRDRCEVHACLSNPCQNGGDCEENGDTYTCRCRRGFYGEVCEYLDRCAYGICENGGRCTLLPDGGYTCRCRDGFTGRNCEQPLSRCDSTPCLNDGLCAETAEGFTCDCRSGFSGPHCEEVDTCYPNPCRNDGVCTTLPNGGHTCRCRGGFHGPTCEQQRGCNSSPCLNGGRCLDRPTRDDTESLDYTCVCQEPFTGPRCEYRNPCYINPCLNGGRCESEPSEGGPPRYRCTCADGFSGDRCESRDACYVNPCLNGGKCTREPLNGDRYTCICADGYQGPRCQDRDACYNNPCLNGGQCTREPLDGGRYTCICADGYYGPRCQDRDACYNNPCLNGGKCNRAPLGGDRYTCICADGYYGPRCQDRDACYNNPCLNGGKCTREPLDGGRYTCICADGYYGPRCQDRDACYTNPCLNGGRCTRNPLDAGGFTCSCTDGFSGPRCEDRELCYENPCQNGGRCTVNPQHADRYECICADGFSGPRCEESDVCYRNPCLNGGKCEPNGRRYTCTCADGFSGPRCEERNACHRNPCLNGGRCRADPLNHGRYTCTCAEGYTGQNCEDTDACFRNPCLNRGRCISDPQNPGDYTCVCADGFFGRRCQDNDACILRPCKNGGQCLRLPSSGDGSVPGYTCRCPSSHYGDRCEFENPCAVNPCQNGGVCERDSLGEFSCRCRLTHYGDRCELTDYCRASPCRNGGTCTNEPSRDRPYTCECSDGYTGPLCEVEDSCRRNPCLNRGTCRMEGGDFRCICADSYHGKRCELVDYCARNPCMNRGRCVNEDTGTGFKCLCPDSHTGIRCERPNQCRPNPCLNGGRCRSLEEGGYACECPPTHSGPSCRSRNFCYSNPCLNGGNCLNNIDGYFCECTPGYGGDRCEHSDPCRVNPCKNAGLCQASGGTYTCRCPIPYTGDRCQYSNNICIYQPDSGNCQNSTTEKRWYFDKFAQKCQQFVYSGCGGNSNNFPTRQACKQSCLVGVCCMIRFPSLEVNGHSAPVSYNCQLLSVGQCKRMDAQHSEIQVLQFKAGADCAGYQCGTPNFCTFNGMEYAPSTRINIGCRQSCVCRSGGYLECRCDVKDVRREIRQLTTEERASFHAAVRTLKTRLSEDGRNVWDELRDKYQESAPIAQSARYFLLWNRGFLREMELHLKEVDCSVTLPYFDFTMDAGKCEQSDVWQPNFFGGDGDCVPDHPFRNIVDGDAEQWTPCISRSFNTEVSIPNMIDISAALQSRTYEELSSRLKTLVSYVNSFIGGDMATSARAYDPLFYSIHAYIDYVFTLWQKSHPGRRELQHILGVNDIPFAMPPSYLWDGACVEYATIEYPQPCNRSDISEERFAPDGFNLQGYNRQGFNRDGFDELGFNALGRDRYGRLDTRALFKYDGFDAAGYDRTGYDRRGCDRFGFFRNGRNRDGYNVEGFSNAGYNRFGLDSEGYDRRGFDVYGLNRFGNADSSDFYDVETGFNDCCFGRDGITTAGYDRFGFNVEGRDEKGCNYFYNGPYCPKYREKIWKLISVQPLSFLRSIARTCGDLGQLPRSQIAREWVTKPASRTTVTESNRVGTTLAESKIEKLNADFSKRFCFNVDMFLSWCPCLEENYPAICSINPCANAHCELHPTARCLINMCGNTCSAEFYLDGRRVNCEDACSTNPCQNGGTCIPSRFSSASERFQCRCPEDFVGSLCEKPAPDTCMRSKAVGDCQGSVRRWFYNFMTASCEDFVYSGCGGNSNNFPSKKACDLRCSLGACCYRLPKNSTFLVGYDRDGYDRYGFNALGYNRRGQQQSAHDSMPTGNRIHPPKGFGPDGFDIFGYDVNGFDRQGYNKDGFHRDTGFNRTGYNPQGEFDQLVEFNKDGYNRSGLNRAGYTCNGVDREGFNQIGLYYDFEYHCESLLLSECEALKDPTQLEIPFEVISFSPGKTCDEIKCEDECGCKLKDKVYHYGETFQDGCQECTCTLGGSVECMCRILGKRKEIRDMNNGERATYAAAIRKLYRSGKWGEFATQHAEHMPQANGGPLSLPWHRYFLRLVEQELRKVSNCDVHIPYFDWTIDVGNLSNSQVWQANFFGGNGEEETNCVRYHPYSLNTLWHPCIKRRFDESISLPDAVNFHILLHEPNYDNFRIQLEMMSALFHLRVGGHMASPFSPYDPVYISHWAFIDYIWSEWQKKNPMGVSRFPAEHRYVPMKPFAVSPDNVLSSNEQLCVIYIPPTLGSPCNDTEQYNWPASVRDSHGLDRHGFDEYGFDVDGYNVEGLHRAGNLDRRRIYNEAGYDESGYHRSGFDHSGWDKYNYNKYDFNRDGFDIERFDASGYDRHGYDRDHKTSFGLYQNMSFALGFDRGYAASLFDRFGYNRYGYDKNGFNRRGFDMFGFNRNGLDEDSCNFYYHGPHYMRYFYFAHDQLAALGKDMLQNIERICPPITPLPDYWVTHIWMEKMPVARNFEKSWKETHPVDKSWKKRTSSVTEELLWLPLTPDQQFCFNMNWHSGCPLGTKLMECSEDLCAQSHCASQPRAECRVKNCGACYPEFYDGRTGEVHQCYGCVSQTGEMHNEGSTWHDGCNTCLCQAGLITCSPMLCPQLSCSHPATDPNGCCGVCGDCEYEDRVYRNRQRFQPNSCNVCECVDGSVMCKETVRNCPPVTCEHPITMPGECCPTCRTDCHGHRNGDTWAMDKCSNCTCMANMMVCKKNPCPVVQCEHPRTMAGECCPKCHGCEYNDSRYRHLQNFMKDICTQCRCTFGNVKCTTQQCPPLMCEHKETPPGSCCQRCRQGCEYEGIFYDNDVSFQSQNNPCLNCSCQNGKARCARMTCPRVTCARPIMRPGECCPQCASCQEGNRIFREGQMWTSADGCQNCACQRGEKICRNKIPCDTCTHGIRRRGRCCPDCSHCSFGGRVFRHLEPFTDPNDVCKSCSCQSGNVICSDIQCPTLTCKRTETATGECCPRCKSCVYDGSLKEHGSSWRIPQDACTTCSCQEGRVECRDQRCPPARCDYPRVSGNVCCPECTGCSYRGNDYDDGDTVESDDPCSTCQCMRGNVICRPGNCPNDDVCDSSAHGSSCPSCTYEGQTFEHGSTFISPRDPCLHCMCRKGKVSCRRNERCERPRCPNPGRKPQQCCPSCESCTYENRNYDNGTTFTPSGADSCISCSCLAGTVRCATQSCPSLDCPNPVRKPDQCCPVCESCSVDGVTRNNKERWRRDMCTICTCNSGRIDCEPRSCPPTACSHPAKLPGECCPNCENCLYGGRVISDGQRFASPTDPCSACTCRAGSVACIRLECPRLDCEAPVVLDGACCPSCPTDCEFMGVSIVSGETITHPTHSCQKCTCRDGAVECDRNQCPRETLCRHPSGSGCCRKQCTDCRYRGKLIKNGQTVSHSSDPCKACTCTNGNVVCIRERCERNKCDNPTKQPGTCCPECPEALSSCSRNGSAIRHGAQFTDGCRICRCQNGGLECRPVACPATTCSHPVKKDCCLSCTGCKYSGISYKDGQEISKHGSGECEVCHCRGGNVMCQPKQCPAVHCSHPRNDGCCPTCDGCTHDGKALKNGDAFPDPSARCNKCVCKSGAVTCSRETCDQVGCTHPLKPEGACCPDCSGDCLLDGRVYRAGDGMFTLPSDTHNCKVCVCSEGSIQCKEKPCPVTNCRNPVSNPCGCSTCEDCLYDGAVRRNKERFPNPENPECSSCFCSGGNVVCGKRRCESAPCTHPSTNDCDCPVCDRCLYLGTTFENEEVFEDAENSCNQCTCQDGNVQCSSRTCKSVGCPDPVTDSCGCPTCGGCTHAGVDYAEGDRFADPSDKCKECMCRAGMITCVRVRCPIVSCPNPVKAAGDCCATCMGTCHAEGRIFENGATFTMNSDPCSVCSCSSGEIRCVRQRCDVRCTNPITQSKCCPDCSACLYHGQRYEEGAVFVPRENNCKQCSCYRGNIICNTIQCSTPACANPQRIHGKCCPQCPEALTDACTSNGIPQSSGAVWTQNDDHGACQECRCRNGGIVSCAKASCSERCTHPVPALGRCCATCGPCFYGNHTYQNGAVFQSDRCTDCVCKNGNVNCVSRACLPLECGSDEQVQGPGDCCRMCTSCVVNRQRFSDGQSWTSPDDRCAECQCNKGIVTCSKVQCLQPCRATVTVLTQCCPVCAGCYFNSQVYKPGETFQSNPMDPCEVCTCEVSPSGAPYTSCKRKQCPSLADCPRSCVKRPQPRSCCPTCSTRPECEYGMCDSASHGNTVVPANNACYSCECTAENTWLCLQGACKPLNCAMEKQYTPQGACCPICDECYLDVENTNVPSGKVWRRSECEVCRCDKGYVSCMRQSCPQEPLMCEAGAVPFKQPGQCCTVCRNMGSPCTFEGRSVMAHQKWKSDPCTTCTCFAGKVNCVTERCMMVTCGPTEAPVKVPGECCPRCLPRPMSCVAFGDMHYLSYDGRMLHFNGACRYLLTADCNKSEFKIIVHNSNFGGMSRTEQVTILTEGGTVALMRDYSIRVNGTVVPTLPLYLLPYYYIEMVGNHVHVSTHTGVHVYWNARIHHIEVSVPGTYKRRTCGLCGNFNNYPQDDARLHNSRLAMSDAEFGNDWKVNLPNAPPCPDVTDTKPCSTVSYAMQQVANEKCSILRSPVFTACHAMVNPEMYFASCVYDVCKCGENDQMCLCSAIEAYAAHCRRAGVMIRWRSQTLCAIVCPYDRGYVFNECGSPCRRTCTNRNLFSGAIPDQCYQPCISGCQCQPGMVEHDGRCIHPDMCPTSISSTVTESSASRLPLVSNFKRQARLPKPWQVSHLVEPQLVQPK